MPKGYNGKIARVNLTNGKISVEEPSRVFYRKYLGGKGIALYYLLKELDKDTDPLGPENKLIFAASVTTGAPVPGLSRHSVAAKSPLTGGYGEGEAGGYWGVELKRAGYDALIIEGKAKKPVYLWVHDGKVEIKNGEHIWGKDTGDAQQMVRGELKDEKVQVSLIGQGGENKVRYAAIMSGLKDANARTGLGAVMGSKNLKAVAVRGKKIEFADLEGLKKLAKWFAENFKNNADNDQLNKYGTSQYTMNSSAQGTLPTRNFQAGTYEGVEGIGHLAMHEKLVIGQEGCYACPVRCKRVCKLDKPFKIDPIYGGPEYESIAALGSLCGMTDARYMVKANELCNRYGLDTISTGATIAFVMECVQRKVISKEILEGIDLTWGNGDAMLEMIRKIAFREGIGDALAEGTKRLSEKWGKGSEKFAMQVKGQEYAMHEPRGKFGVGLAFAVSNTGADHLQHEHDGAFDPQLAGYAHHADEPSAFMKELFPLGILEPVKSLYIGREKVRLFTYYQHYWSLFDCLGVCIFVFAPVRTFKMPMVVDMVNCATGWNTSLWELMKVGERATTMARVFNIKHGKTKDEDKLPERTLEPMGKGAIEGTTIPRDEFYEAIRCYYGMMGWDRETGIPTYGKLDELDIPWVADMIGVK